MTLTGNPTKPGVGEPGKERSRDATLVERIEEVGDEVSQNESDGQRRQGCGQPRVVDQRRELEGDRPENIHYAGGSKRT